MNSFYHILSGRIKSLCEREFIGRPAGIWFVIFVLFFWTLSKFSDVYFLIHGQTGMMTLISLLVIVSANLLSLKCLLSYKKSLYEFTTYWLWVAYVVSVILMPQYMHHDGRWETFLTMAVVMSPVLVSWLILRSRAIKKFFESE